MAKHTQATVRYDGPALKDHQMDVQELAPALLALGEMIQLANKKLNGDAASMKVLVKADVEQKCFQLDIQLVQTVLESAKHLFGTDEYKTAREIAELMDLLLPYGAAAAGGVFWFWRKFYSEKEDPEATTSMNVEQHGGQTTLVTAQDGGAVQVNNNTYILATDPDMIALGQKVLHPLKRDGYESLSFYQGETPSIEWAAHEAKAFMSRSATELAPPPEDDTVNRTPIRTIVSVKTQRNEGKAQWEIKWANKAEWAFMEDLDWLEQFQAGNVPFQIPYWLDVTLEMVTSRVNPDEPPSFAIKKVHDLVNGSDGKQGDLLDD